MGTLAIDWSVSENCGSLWWVAVRPAETPQRVPWKKGPCVATDLSQFGHTQCLDFFWKIIVAIEKLRWMRVSSFSTLLLGQNESNSQNKFCHIYRHLLAIHWLASKSQTAQFCTYNEVSAFCHFTCPEIYLAWHSRVTNFTPGLFISPPEILVPDS